MPKVWGIKLTGNIYFRNAGGWINQLYEKSAKIVVQFRRDEDDK
ncbi:hypothetical protein [Heyndrickxia sporothermodurans]|uniref:Uncharacterized protein n=1 Tax=Heyndrickxia sporothermodurans TaxID=46224 RepID=A0A150LCC2_9BACI|nr:hypothetical protein B4102_2401 [Heyndrickxia sporothermodurans]